MTEADARFGTEAADESPRLRLLIRESIHRLFHGRCAAVSRPGSRSLREVELALRGGALVTALREIDRAWRTARPEDAELLAPVYARLLALEGQNHGATLRLLQRITTPDPEVAALTILTLLQLRRGHEAQQLLESALGEFCVKPDGLLAHAASESLSHLDTGAPGWIGRGPRLEVVGVLRDANTSHPLEVSLDAGPAFLQLITPVRQNDRQTFRFSLPQRFTGAALRVRCGGSLLLGSELRVPTDFGLDGRAVDTMAGRRISGWARMGWLPDRPLDLCVEDENGRRRVIKTGKLPKPGLRWPFTLDLRRLGIYGNRLQFSARTPDGRWQPLPDSPLLLAPAIRLPGRKSRAPGRWCVKPTGSSARLTPKHAPSIDIIIPVYRGRQETLQCIDAAGSTARQAAVIVVNDATDDPVLAAALDELEAAGRITLLRNVENLGFVASVNRALALNPTHDAVLLNSDALVFGDWLERLQATAYGTPRVGTVTPFSNSGTIAGYPRHGEQVLSADDAAALHQLAASSHAQVSREIPVGVGFCLYVRRDCLREVGEFDAAAFGKGYGEESDFCMRARLHGWSHRLAADVFVYHAGGRSFGSRRAALLDRSRRLMNLRHPGYDRYIADFIAKDPLFTLRRTLDAHRLAAVDGAFVLLVTLALTGGVQRFVTERCREIRARGLVPLILRPSGDARRCEVWTDALDVSNVRYDIPSELQLLDALLRRLPIQYVEIQHFLHLDPRVIDAVRGLGLPYDVFVHDYAWICPRITLIDGSGAYCGEPAVTVCNACVRRNGSQLGGETMSVGELRQRSATWLSGARRVLAPSKDTALRLQKYFPLAIEVRPHAMLAEPAKARPRPSLSQVVRVAVIGAIGDHKGYRVLLNCARDAQRRSLPLEFVVIGYTRDDRPLVETAKVFITGKYSEGEAGHLLRREQPDIAFLPSVWPETWCYAFDEAVAVGLPVVAFELGAIAERIREMAVGAMLPLGEKPRHINDRLLEVAAQMMMPLRDDGTTATRISEPGISEPKIMNDKTDDHNHLQNDAFTASVQVLPLPPGLYLFSVKAAATSKESQGQLRLPAMHVGLGPGVRSEQVEFLSGPATDGAWLFAHEDMLITKVSAAGATLILTSVRAHGGEVLSVKVERLEGRSELETAVAETARSPAAKAKAGSSSSITPGGALPLRIGAHIRARGDMSFAGVPWAGRVAPGLWIESFSVKPLEGFEAQDVEYKGLTGSGFETPWMSDDKMCGTKGMSVPLVGFAVRLRPSSKAAQYDCEYSGYFKSGATVGPLRNGAPCRSTVANDPLEGIQVRICKRADAGKPAPRPPASSAQGPSFGRYRDTNGLVAAATGAARTVTKTKSASKRTVSDSHKANGTLASNQRPIARRS